MKYYEEHELAYQQLIDQGYLGWGRKRSIEDLLAFSQRDELDRVLEPLLKPGQKILDLGCGTGPVAFHLATGGRDVTGIDISETAIASAKALGARLNSSAQFICADFLEAGFDGENFSIVIDSSFLHCIVFDQERLACLRRVYELLEPGGTFILHTMISDQAFDFGPRFHFDAQEILWYLSNRSAVTEAKPYGAGYSIPKRRILSSFKIGKELRSAGFTEIRSKILAADSTGGAAVLFGAYQKPCS